MSGFTKKAIMQTFVDMLEEMPFDKITVSAIVKRCGVSHNTFYYHYHDIYELLDFWLRDVLDRYTAGADLDNWPEKVKALLHGCQEHPKIVYHTFDSLSRDHLERYAFQSYNDAILTYVKSAADGWEIPAKKLEDISDFCLYAMVGFFLKFLWNNMADDIDATVDELAKLVDCFLTQAILMAAESDT